jgi:SSS family solute:Na+ symporter
MVAALLAALMSTVSGALNSISTLFSFDIYKRLRPGASDRRLVWIGRVTAGVALLAAIGLVPLLNGYPSIFLGVNDIIAHIAPPVTCVFLLGVFWKGASARSAKLTLWFGSALGAAVYVLGKLGDATPLATLLDGLSGSSFMMMAFYLLCACIFMQIVFSMIWPSGEKELGSKLYWRHPLEPLRDKGWPLPGNYKFLSLLLLAVMCVLYYIFR